MIATEAAQPVVVSASAARGYEIALAVVCAFPVLMGLVAAWHADRYAVNNRAKRDRGERYGATSAPLLRIIGLSSAVAFGAGAARLLLA
jgi:hypothetical protein